MNLDRIQFYLKKTAFFEIKPLYKRLVGVTCKPVQIMHFIYIVKVLANNSELLNLSTVSQKVARIRFPKNLLVQERVETNKKDLHNLSD